MSPWSMNLRTLLYDARSTSIENVDSGVASVPRKGFS
jgi:hypothetical protein